MIKRLFASAALALVLVGCATPTPPATQAAIETEVLRAELIYEAVQKGAIMYVERPTCTVPKTVVICATPEGRAAVRKANRAGNVALDKLEKLAAIPGVTSGELVSSVSAVITAVDGVRTVLAMYN